MYLPLCASVVVVAPPLWFCVRKRGEIRQLAQRGIQGSKELHAQQPPSDKQLTLLQGTVIGAESSAHARAAINEYMADVKHALQGTRFSMRAAARVSLFAGTAMSLALTAFDLGMRKDAWDAYLLAAAPFGAGSLGYVAALALGHSAEQWGERARDAWNGVAQALHQCGGGPERFRLTQEQRKRQASA